MGRKLDLSSLTEEEAAHVLQVVQRDMQLRKTEEDRFRELKQELEEEKSRCTVLSRQRGFNERCCMRCCSPFGFLLAPRYTCLSCGYNVCRHCCCYARARNGWLCSTCQRTRLLKTRSLEWFYSSVRRRFKRFGSDKVLKTLYRRVTTPPNSQGEFTGGSTYDESAGNESSVSESDSTFYRHSKEHSMAETTSVARRVAEEAVDEAIAKSESHTHNQQKLKEAQYLQDNRGELIEELTSVIVQKIIHKRRGTSETQPEWPPDGNSEASCPSTPRGRPHSSMGSKSSFSNSLWRSQSALALHTEDVSDQGSKANQGPVISPECTQGLKKEGAVGPTLPSWKSVDRLDNSSSSMLQSPDGNWITMQSTQLSRPSLLTKRKSLVFTALEKESGAVSAYDGLCSDTEPDTDGTWGAALLEFRHKMSSNMSNGLRSTSPQSPAENSSENTQTDSGQETAVFKPHKGHVPVLKRKATREHRRSSILDMDFHPDPTESSEEGSENSRAKRTRRKRRSKQSRGVEEGFTSPSLSEPDCSRMLLDVLMNHQSKRQVGSETVNDKLLDDTSESATPDAGSSGAVTPRAPVVEESHSEHHILTDSSGHKLTSTLSGPFSETKGDLTIDVEMVGGGHENRWKDGEEGTGELLRDVEAEEELEESLEIEHGKEEKTGKKLPVVWKTRAAMGPDHSSSVEDGNTVLPTVGKKTYRIDKKSVNSRKLNRDLTDTFHHEVIQETTKKQSESETKRSAESSWEKCLGQESETAGETKDREESKAGGTKSEELTRPSSVTANWKRKRTSRSGSSQMGSAGQVRDRHITEVETRQEQECQGGCQPEKRGAEAGREGEKTEKGHRAARHEGQEQTVETGSIAESEGSKRASEEWTDEVKNQRELALTKSEEEEAEYERMIDSVVRALESMEREIEADLSDTRSDVTAEQGKEEEEIEEKAMTQVVEMEEDIETKLDKERANVGKQLQAKVMEKEGELDWLQSTEENSCVIKTEQYKDHSFKEDLDSALSGQGEFLTPEEIYNKYSAASLRSITTEVLKVLNATEDLIRGTSGNGVSQSESQDLPPLPPEQSKRLDEQLSHLEENVYVAASAAFGLEAELEELAECARSVCSTTSEGDLAELEEQVASAAAQVQQSELQVTDIAARIAALKNAGLNVAPQTRVTKLQTIESCRQHRRRLPAPPVQEKKA